MVPEKPAPEINRGREPEPKSRSLPATAGCTNSPVGRAGGGRVRAGGRPSGQASSLARRDVEPRIGRMHHFTRSWSRDAADECILFLGRAVVVLERPSSTSRAIYNAAHTTTRRACGCRRSLKPEAKSGAACHGPFCQQGQ